MDKCMMIFDDGKIDMLVATDCTYDECVEIKLKQEKPECYRIIPVKEKDN